jgi:hypothetical protein
MPNEIIWQDKFPERCVEVSTLGCGSKAEAWRLRIGVRVERGLWRGVVARPEPGAAHFMRIRFPHHGIRKAGYATRMERSLPSRKPCNRQIETAPEEMDRARLPKKPTSE